ncbi:MAG: DNA polymerase III subunit beta [Candidatus Paceibacterota bacterium]|jgi:DNA polymerase-3 subunit beta
MNIVILKNNIKEGLAIIAGAHKEGSHLPVLKNFLFVAHNDVVQLTSTDLELAMQYTVSAKIINDGSIAIPFSIFSQIISNLSSERISFEHKGSSLLVVSDNYKAKITTANTDEYPIIPVIEDGKAQQFTFDPDAFIDGLAAVSSACQISDIRPELSGAYVSYKGGVLKFVATDSFRLAEKIVSEKKYETTLTTDIACIIPLKTIQEVVRVFSLKKDGKITMRFDDHQIEFKTEHISIISRLIEGKFPDYSVIIPGQFSTEVVLKTSDVIAAVKVTSSLSNRLHEVKFVIDDTLKNIQIISMSQEFGESEYILPAKIKGQTNKITFNWRFVLDGLKNIKTENVLMGFNGEDKPTVFKSPDDTLFLYIVMPIKSA